MRVSKIGRRKAEVTFKESAMAEQAWVAGKWKSSFELTLPHAQRTSSAMAVALVWTGP